ncbi:hypothetical protein ACHAWC_010371 [Mediolabrus comicus]
MTWLSLAINEINRRGDLNNEIITVLRAFGKDDADAPGPADLNPDSSFVKDNDQRHDDDDDDDDECAMTYLQNRIARELLDEIDIDQANMFGRRFASVSTLLKSQQQQHQQQHDHDNNAVSTEQLLRLALYRRTVQILSTTDPILSQRKALRIRALVDFIWSQSLVLGLADEASKAAATAATTSSSSSDAQQHHHHHPSLVELVHQMELQNTTSKHYNEFSPGFYHATITGTTKDFGPVHINILRIHLKQKENGGCIMKCLDAREVTTDLTELAYRMGAVAAISGGFFLYSEPDIVEPSKRTDPVGLLVSDGDVCLPPVFQRATIFQKSRNGNEEEEEEEGLIDLDKIGMDGVTCILKLCCGSGEEEDHIVELVIGKDGVKCTHRGDSEQFHVVKNEVGLAIVGGQVVAISSTLLHVPLAGYILSFPKSMVPSYINDNGVSISVEYKLPPSISDISDAMAGGPMFFSESVDENDYSMELHAEDFRGTAPPVTFSQDETFDRNLLPRMGVGITKDGEELICVAVDGRNLEKALGLTLQGTSDLLKALGCTKAMNLDGGSSKRMVIFDQQTKKHKVVCLSTTEIKANAENKTDPSRPVHSAILFLPQKT